MKRPPAGRLKPRCLARMGVAPGFSATKNIPQPQPGQNSDLYDSIVNADVPGSEGDSIAGVTRQFDRHTVGLRALR